MNDSSYRSIWTYLCETPFFHGWVDAGGIKTRYIDAGPRDAEPIIMLHGTASGWEAFCANIPEHAKTYRCLAFDLVGSGFSSKPDNDYEIADYVRHVHDFMSVMKIGNASFIGVSLGAWVACQLALDHPELVRRMTLVAASGLVSNAETMGSIRSARTTAVDDPSWANVKAIFNGLIYDEANRIDDLVAIRQRMYRQPEMKQAMNHILCLQDAQIRARNLIPEERWCHIRVPALVFAAPHDRPDFYQTALKASRLIANARLIEVSNVKHWTHFERAELFNQHNLEFMRSS
jgi:pimeloyl-ACP methyl ester carboxylesterase